VIGLRVAAAVGVILWSVVLLAYAALFLGAICVTVIALIFVLGAFRSGGSAASPFGFALAFLGFALLMLQIIRVNSGFLPIFALRDSGEDIVCRRSILPLLAMFFALMGITIGATRSVLETAWSTGTAIWCAATVLIALALLGTLIRLRRPLTIDSGGVSDAGLRGRKIALDTILDSYVRNIAGQPYIVLLRREASSVMLLAFDLIVTPESVADAINRRITAAQSE